MPDIWIQRADFSVEDRYDLEPQVIVDILQATNWTKLIAETLQLQVAGELCCHSGFGIVFETGDILHLFEPENPPYKGVFHYYSDRKILGLFPVTDSFTQSFQRLTKEKLAELLENWMPDRSDDVIDCLLHKESRP